MIVLCGIAISNYYNKVKLALLEKGIPFTEEPVKTGRTDDAVLSASPLGKVPFIRTEAGTLCESQPILEYLEAAYPEHPLLPRDPYRAAKVRELINFIDLHLELTSREVYSQAFEGKPVSDEVRARTRTRLEKHIAGFKKLAKFSPYIAGDEYTMADCAAFASIPLVSLSTRLVYGENLIAAGGIDWKPYSKLMGERPSSQRMLEDRKAATAAR